MECVINVPIFQLVACIAAGADGQVQEESNPQRLSLFQDEQLNSFFRRLAWSPDGELLSPLP